ncbi:uncharacterized protein LOC117590813 [Drosophila guanche]|uniref:Uncharacterized protein n=1 Tax=Drosophila guanche TaxID=7266 RepID=A0A3B0K510_DROGU|nr:uncharacterized protein LOC117590813 [Drosophila guanche]SPP89294.1 Hypothetical predicted protein [Drosophila guanche]
MEKFPGLLGLGLVLAGLLLAAGTLNALPMTNDLELVAAFDGIEPVQESAAAAAAQPSHISRIAARGEVVATAQEDRPELFNTIVQELYSAGVYTAERRDLNTLSYKELIRLLGLWHLSSGRNYYEASAAPAVTAG